MYIELQESLKSSEDCLQRQRTVSKPELNAELKAPLVRSHCREVSLSAWTTLQFLTNSNATASARPTAKPPRKNPPDIFPGAMGLGKAASVILTYNISNQYLNPNIPASSCQLVISQRAEQRNNPKI